MRPKAPRVTPLEKSDWNAEQRELLAPIEAANGRIYNIFKTLVRHPKLLKRWLPLGNHLLFKSSLAPRDRELLILRTAWLARAEYEWGQHVVIAAREGLTPAEIERVAEGPRAAGWAAGDAALLAAADELFNDTCLSDASWAALSERYATAEIMDIVFTVGAYAMLAMALNSFGVALDPGLKGFASG
ncbi:MAG TPA: carboxymuconolactone decarboxylase family protein [Stellaceae bacterium]|nr:carboxymuconolactone decarboxylase family protein [Stellaceae bacterium]